MGNETLFPHLTSTGHAPTHREVLTAYRTVFAARVAEGKLRPLVFPYHLSGCMILLVYLCIPHTKSPLIYAARWPVLAAILWFQWNLLWDVSSSSMAGAFMAGLVAAWGAVWSISWLLLYRLQFDARRVERRKVERRGSEDRQVILEQGNTGYGLHVNGHSKAGEKISDQGARRENGSATTVNIDEGLRPRGQANRTAHREKAVKGQDRVNGHAQTAPRKTDENDREDEEYFWQSYPDNFQERLSWVTDLLMNFRGPGWNWAIPPMPALSPSIKAKLREPIDDASTSGVSSVGLRRFDTRRELFKYRMPQFIMGYFLIDIIKTAFTKDPYYSFGPNTYALPPHLAKLTPFQLDLFRQCLNAAAIVIVLEMIFMLAPLTMCLLLGPKVIGLRGEAWYYPTTWGSFSNVLNKGLSGFWGGWWHQTFRFIFAAPTNYLIEKGYVKARSKEAKLCAPFFAFGISGILHAAGSITQLPRTKPWQAPIFFMLHGLGILLQSFLCAYLHPYIFRLPKPIRQAGNLLFIWTWFWYTGWLLVDDFARGGVWLWEPLPISPMRALGYGVPGDSWWCWQDVSVGWYTGKHWWESGIAI
jgi:hypothetical protein